MAPIDSHPKQDGKQDETTKEVTRAGVALSASEVVQRYGSANAEFLKGYAGIDNETGQVFAKSLSGIAKGKINPDFADNNIKQQAGYSAEVAATSRDNAEAIISKQAKRVSRSDDLAQYGRNHNVVDRVTILNGEIIEGSQSQMKFVGNREDLFKKIAEDTQKGDAEFARYRGIKLEIPSEQFEGAAEACRDKANELREQAAKAANAGAPDDVVARLRKNADNYDQLADNITDSRLTTKQALAYRNNPRWETAKDIARTSHRAGMEGAKYGAIIGGSISLLTNVFAVAQDKKQLDEAAKDVLLDTGKGVIVGYATAATGAAIKGAMQQSGKETLRALSKTNAATLALNACISLGSSITRYVNDEITEAELLEEVGEKGAGMLSSGMYAALGQLAIPIPFVGAAVGGMIGYTLSSMFYQAALGAAKDADAAKVNLARVREIEAAAREEIDRQRTALDEFMHKEFPELLQETEQLFAHIEAHDAENVDAFAAAINRYAELLGAQLQFKNQMEFDGFMESDAPLRL